VGAPRWSVFALAAVVNLAVCVPRPAQAVLLPSVVMSAEELAAANAGQGWLESAATLAAPVAVAVLLNAGGAAAAVSGIVVLASVSLLLVATIPGPVPYAQAWESEPDAQDELGSLRLLADNPAVMTLVAVLGAQYILVGALDLIGLGVDLAGIWASWVGGRRRRPALVIGPAACPVWSPFG
jgi:hypothetical protein